MSRDPNDINYDPTLPPEPWGHAIDAGRFLGDVVRLMAYISVGPNVSMIWRRERTGPDRSAPDEPLEQFRGIVEVHAKSEIPRLMISVAATLRAKLDDGSWKATEETVGWINPGEVVEGPHGKHGEALGVREACNKIIHAKKVEPQHTRTDSGMQAIGALIHLFGDRRGEQWSVELNLQAFCIAVANVDFYPHHTGCRS